MLQNKPDHTAKIVIMGNSSVGKTHLTSAICSLSPHNIASTVGTDIFKLPITTHNNERIMLHFWDTAGQERYRNISNIYMKGVDAVIFVYSLDDAGSYQGMKTWLKQLDVVNTKSVVIAVVGNKLDLNEGYVCRKQQLADMQQLRQQYSPNNVQQFVVSAKTGQNMGQLKQWLIDRISQKMKQKNPIGDRPIYLSVANSSVVGDRLSRMKDKDRDGGCC